MQSLIRAMFLLLLLPTGSATTSLQTGRGT
jgi:hypothetical protein